VRDLLMWRKLGKLKGTYADGLIGHIRDDGRVHPSIHPDGARTGRTSSSEPNLQNQPSTESPDPEQAKLAKMLRDCFVPAPGHVLVEFDYSQLELRVAADLSGDPAMLAIFQRGEDYHLRTAKMLSQTLWGITPEEVTGAHRREVKACIAEGSLVLTSNGLKPIQDVALDDLLWDGCEWVFHGGVVYQGTREVITHDGLTATPDHVVFTADGREVAFQVAAQEGCGLAVTAASVAPARYAPAARRTIAREVPLDDSRNVLRVSAQPAVERGQRTRKQDADLPVHDEPADTAERRNALRGPKSENTCAAVQRDLAAHAESKLRSVCGVRGAGDTNLVCEPCRVRELRPAGASAPDLQGRADRPREQRRALRTGQPSDGRAACEPAEYSAQSALSLQGPAGIAVGLVAPTDDRSPDLRLDPAQDGSLSCSAGSGREHPCAEAPQEVGAHRVYDILDAGPRNRFTVSGRLVHNCNFALLYDDSPHGIAYRIGITPEKAEEIRDAIFGCFPILAKWIKARVAETQRTGYAWTWWAGQPARRRPLTPVADPESPAGKTARRGAWNGPIQGTGNEYLVASAIECVDWILGDGIPARLLVTIHDSMLFEVREDAVSEVHERVPEIMAAHQTKNGVPLLADAKVGRTWARMRSWKAGTPMPNLDAEEK
jgi:DNA polymerase